MFSHTKEVFKDIASGKLTAAQAWDTLSVGLGWRTSYERSRIVNDLAKGTLSVDRACEEWRKDVLIAFAR